MFDDPGVTFAASGLDRAAHLRADASALADLWAAADSRVLPLWQSRPLCAEGGLGWLHPAHPALTAATTHCFLGLADGRAYFAADLSFWQPPEGEMPDRHLFLDPSRQPHPLISGGLAFAELRSVMADLSPEEAELAASAKALMAWHETHGFCARCGGVSQLAQGGWQRKCPACGALHFPRTDPVVIMRVTRGNSLLLGRSPGWPDGMYSLLAGFMEPGETIENAVRREVFEETGVRVGRVGYLASQPWPFPASLMIGCAAEALGQSISLDPNELDHALWVTREELALVFSDKHATIRRPRTGSIAAFLMKEWLADRWLVNCL
ncbi:MAG: NAD(+) diphosphatase [Rhodobacteraceae bacterium]|nr:NAD(+) diphosphatase [Paracoccaceae bacterium]